MTVLGDQTLRSPGRVHYMSQLLNGANYRNIVNNSNINIRSFINLTLQIFLMSAVSLLAALWPICYIPL